MLEPEKKRIIPFGGPDVQHPDLESARIVVLPLCYEHAPSYGGGSSDGPYHLTTASEQLEQFDEETLADWGAMPIHTLPPMHFNDTPEKCVMEMKAAAMKIMGEDKFLLSLGGDHAISIGPILGASEIWQDLGVLQVDAHLDLRYEWNGSRFNHACVMRRVLEAGVRPLVQVGIRAFSKEEHEVVVAHGLKPFYAHRIESGKDTWIDDVLEALPEKIYLTVDLDGLDPSEMPGTGTPEPGGLSYRQLVGLIRAVGRHKKVVAADVSELAKIEGSQVSETMAARVAEKIIVYCSRR
jgi:agmatinase